MRLLLDSNALLAWITRERFDRGARRRVEQSPTFVSALSVWELGDKIAAGKLRVDGRLSEEIALHGFDALSLTFEHAAYAARLPRLHRDPIDRMLIAQARVENLTIVTRDETFDAYDVDVIRC
jgi:PIN domain nuclease of toxin-antitoxin system